MEEEEEEEEDGVIGIEMRNLIREWAQDVEKRVFAEETVALKGRPKEKDKGGPGPDEGQTDEVRFTPGVMTRRR